MAGGPAERRPRGARQLRGRARLRLRRLHLAARLSISTRPGSLAHVPYVSHVSWWQDVRRGTSGRGGRTGPARGKGGGERAGDEPGPLSVAVGGVVDAI